MLWLRLCGYGQNTMKAILFMKRFVKLISLALATCMLASVLTVLGCKKDDGKDSFGLTDTQRANILAISEAFVESGKTYNNDYALSVKEIEQFIYYLYNDELTSEIEGYGIVSGDDALARIKMFFGISSVLHTHKSTAEPDFYYYNKNYYVKTNSPVVTESDIVFCKQDESGNYNVTVQCSGVDDMRIDLEFVFTIEGDEVLVRSCTRYDER